MKNIFRSILIGLLVSQSAFATWPASIQGQSDAGPTTKMQFQVPNNQYTNLGGSKALIETGNANILPNPGFEGTTGWTASGGLTAAINTAAKGTGAKGYDWDSNAAAQTLTGTAVTIPEGLKGKNAVVSCNIKTVSGTATHTLAAWDGTTAWNPATINSVAGAWQRTSVNFIMPSSGTITLQMKSVAADEPEIYVDDCIIEDAAFYNVTSVPLATDTTAYILPPINGGTATYTYGERTYQRVGDKLYISYSFTVTANGSGSSNVGIPLPAGLNIDFTKIASNGDTNLGTYHRWSGTVYNMQGMVRAVSADPNNLYLYIEGSASARVGSGLGSGQIYYITTAGIPIVGWTSNGSGYRPDQTPASWYGALDATNNTWSVSSATFADFSAGTSVALTIRGTPRNITCTAASGSLPGITCTLPKSGDYTICDTTSGTITTSGGGTWALQLLESTTSTVINAAQHTTSSGNGIVSGVSGCGPFTASAAGSYTFKLQGQTNVNPLVLSNSGFTGVKTIEWAVMEGNVSQGGAYFQNQISSNTSGQEHLERIAFSGNGTMTANCTGSPCTISSQSGSWASSVTRSTTGTYVINAVSGEWSATPICVPSGDGGVSNPSCNMGFNASTSTAITIYSKSAAGSLTDGGCDLLCMGPR